MEYYSATTGTVLIWVKIPNLNSTADSSNTAIFLWYGNAAVTTFQGGAAGSAWDIYFAGAWHLPNGSTLTALDSTSNGNNGTLNGATPPSAAAGKMDGAASFPSSAAYVDAGNSASLNTSGAITVSCWINPAAWSGYVMVVTKNVGTGTSGWWLGGSNSGWLDFKVGASDAQYRTFTPTAGTWYYITGIFNPSTSQAIYVNGVSKGTTAAPTSITTNSQTVQFGNSKYWDSSTYQFNGLIDEVHISNTARSASWITAEYNNQNSPGTFFTVGGTAYSASPSETNLATDTLSRLGNFLRGDSETQSANDSLNRMGSFARGDTESFSAADALARQANYARAGAETNLAGDALNRAAVYIRAAAEQQTAADSLARMAALFRQTQETETVGDFMARTLAANRAAVEMLAVSDLLNDLWARKLIVQPWRALDVPGRPKSGAAPAPVKSGTATSPDKAGSAPRH